MSKQLKRRGVLLIALAAPCILLGGCWGGTGPSSSGHVSLSPQDRAHMAALADGLSNLIEEKESLKEKQPRPEVEESKSDKGRLVIRQHGSIGSRLCIRRSGTIVDFVIERDVIIVTCVRQGQPEGSPPVGTVVVKEFLVSHVTPGFSLDEFLTAVKGAGITAPAPTFGEDDVIEVQLTMPLEERPGKPLVAVGMGASIPTEGQ